jgi:hypothetical protein
MFYVFVKNDDQFLFAATDEPTGSKIPQRENWKQHSNFSDDGQPRTAFKDDEARAAILKNGYYIFRTEVKVTMKRSDGSEELL